MPGVTSWICAGRTFRKAAISSGEQTSPRRLDFTASCASRKTCFSVSTSQPVSASVSLLELVSTVTPRTSGTCKPSDFARVLRGFFRRAHHFATAAGVDGEHLHVEPDSGHDRLGDGIRDVVKFQVEKYARARRANFFHDVRPGGGEQFAADLECANRRGDLRRKFQRLFRRRHVERRDDGIFVSHKRTQLNTDEAQRQFPNAIQGVALARKNRIGWSADWVSV